MAPDSVWIVQAGKQTYEWWPIAVCSMPDEEDHLFTGAEVHANARLMVASPEMYEALREIVRATHDEKGWLARRINGIAFAALSRVDGRQ